MMFMDAVYNLVLTDGDKICNINGVEVATLNHGISGEVIGHEYFGTEKVIEDLKKLEGYDEGYVVIDNAKYIRVDGKVQQMIMAAE